MVKPVTAREEPIGGSKAAKRGRGRPRKTDSVHRGWIRTPRRVITDDIGQASKSAALLKPSNLSVTTSRWPREAKNPPKHQCTTKEATKDVPNVSETPRSCSLKEDSDFILGRLRNREKVKVGSYFVPLRKTVRGKAKRKASETVSAVLSMKKAAELCSLPKVMVRNCNYPLRGQVKAGARAGGLGSHQDEKCSTVRYSGVKSVVGTENVNVKSLGVTKTLTCDMGSSGPRKNIPLEFRGCGGLGTVETEYLGYLKNSQSVKSNGTHDSGHLRDCSSTSTNNKDDLGTLRDGNNINETDNMRRLRGRKNTKINKGDHVNRWRDGNLVKPKTTGYGGTPRLNKQYTPELLRMALEDMKAGRMSCMDAANRYSIPYGTLWHKQKLNGCQEPGPSSSRSKRPIRLPSVSQPANQTGGMVHSGLGKPGVTKSVRTSVKREWAHSLKGAAESSNDDATGRRRNYSDIETDSSSYKRNGTNDLDHPGVSSIISTVKIDDFHHPRDQDKVDKTYNLRHLRDRKKFEVNTDSEVIRWKDGGLTEPKIKGYYSYVRPRVKNQYSRIGMALEDVKTGRMSFKGAADHYSLSYDTLLYKQTSSGCHEAGPSTTSSRSIGSKQASGSQPFQPIKNGKTVTKSGLDETVAVELSPPVKRRRGRPPKIRKDGMGVFKRGRGRPPKIKNTSGMPVNHVHGSPCRPKLDIDLNFQEACQPFPDCGPPKSQLVSSDVVCDMHHEDGTLLEKRHRPSDKSAVSCPPELPPKRPVCPSKMLEEVDHSQSQNPISHASSSTVFGLQTEDFDSQVESLIQVSRPPEPSSMVQGWSSHSPTHSPSPSDEAISGFQWERSDLQDPPPELIQDHELNTPNSCLPPSVQPEISGHSRCTPGIPSADTNAPESPDYLQGSATPCQGENQLCPAPNSSPENSILSASAPGMTDLDKRPPSDAQECTDSSPSQSGRLPTSQSENSKLLCCIPRVPLLDIIPVSSDDLEIPPNHQNRTMSNMTESVPITATSQPENFTAESASGMPILDRLPESCESRGGQENLSHNLNLPTTIDSFPTPPVLQPVSPIQSGFIGSNSPKSP